MLFFDKTLLILDTSTTNVSIGCLKDGKWTSFCREEGPVLSILAPSVKRCLEASSLQLEQVDAILYSQGPGSTLGLRVCQMFVNGLFATNKIALYPYNTLAVGSFLLGESKHHIVSPKSNLLWEVLTREDELNISIQELDFSCLSTLPYPIHYLPLRKTHPLLLDIAKPLDYDLEKAPLAFYNPNLLKVSAPTAHSFQKWTPKTP